MNCPLFERCKIAFEQLGIPQEFLNPEFNKCYCSKCYQDRDVYLRGGEIYKMPLEACRFSINVLESNFKTDVFRKWHNSYHGTKVSSIKSLIKEGYKLPGTKLENGQEIKIPQGHISDHKNDDRKNIYTSSSLKYASYYSDKKEINGKFYKFIVQNRQKPGSYVKENETLREKDNIADKDIDPDEMEWVSKETENIAIIGVLVCEENTKKDKKLIRLASLKAFVKIINEFKIVDLEKKIEDWERYFSNREKVIKEMKKNYEETLKNINKCFYIDLLGGSLKLTAELSGLFVLSIPIAAISFALKSLIKIQKNNSVQKIKEMIN